MDKRLSLEVVILPCVGSNPAVRPKQTNKQPMDQERAKRIKYATLMVDFWIWVKINGFSNSEIGPVLVKIILNEIRPKLEMENTRIEDIEYYHYGMTQLLAECTQAIIAKVIEPRHVKKIIDDCWYRYCGYDLFAYMEEVDLLNEVQGDELLDAVKAAIEANPKAIAEFKAGKEKAIGAVVGAVMKKVKADPSKVQDLIRDNI